MASLENCPFCGKELDGETVVITEKGADGINRASTERGDGIVVVAGTEVHKRCRVNYINKKQIDLSKKAKLHPPPPVKRSARVSIGSYNSKTHCLFCSNEIIKSPLNADFDEYSCVKTDAFVGKILSHCKQRNDDWAFTVQGRIDYFGKDLHAADCLYHRSCDINFRTKRAIPIHHIDGTMEKKSRKAGRPKDTNQEQAFIRMCSFFEENDEEQLTVTDLEEKMTEYMTEPESVGYGNQYLKSKLVKHYGESIFIAEGEGLHDIVTFREKTSSILRDYFNQPENDEESQKRAIIETAAKLIKSDIKSMIPPLTDEYPNASALELQSALEYIPLGLRWLLGHLFVGKDTSRKIASIGQSIVQAVRPRALVVPLQIGFAAQVHHQFRSRFLVDTLSSMGFCSSYSEVQRFEENAAATAALDVLGVGNIGGLDSALLFAADNVDHNIVTLDGKGTFHGMGMIAAITPRRQVSRTVPRRRTEDLQIVDLTKVDVKEYRFTKYACDNIKFEPLSFLEPADHRIDVLWEVSLRFKQTTPNWNGMMHMLHKDCDHPGKSSIVFLPIIDMYSGDKSCIYSTLEYMCNIADKHKTPPIVTFDQPLYWKASEIKHEVPGDSSIRSVVLLLGSFHTLMNLLGAIGTLMDGSGIKEILGTIYGENAVQHIMSGKAVQRALRGHLLLDQCLTQQVLDKVISDDPSFANLLQELEKLYVQTVTGDATLHSVSASPCLSEIVQALSTKGNELSARSNTSKLWLSYQQMLRVARELIEADRTGSWSMHLHAIAGCLPIFAAAGHPNYLKSAYLYLQSMKSLENDNPAVFRRFMNGLNVIRRTDQFWAGLGSDLVIEQALMRSLKTAGGLTRGSGMSEHQRALWTMSVPVSASYSEAMQGFTQHRFVTSEQHKEVTASRMRRDHADLEKIADKFQAFSPFSDDASLRNIIIGLNANEDVNVHNLFTIGEQTVAKMEGQPVFSFSYKRNMKAKTLALAHAVKVTEDRTIGPALLFQRFLVVSQSGELSLEEVMNYELSPYPPSLFEAKDLLRKPDKAQLIDALKTNVTTISDEAVLKSAPEVEHNVLDGGSLLHRLKWTDGRTYSSIADDYASFTGKHYGKATIVFDGYFGGPSTKDNTHLRRAQKHVSNKVNVTEVTKFVGKKEDFLSNDENKQTLIKLISDRMRDTGCHVIQAEGDADLDIVKAAVSMSSEKTTALIGEDTDLLVLLLHYASPTDGKKLYFRSDKGGPTVVYDIKVMKQVLGCEICHNILFLHAFTGCDTTSRIFGIGKKSVLQKMIKGDPIFKSCARVFSSPGKDAAEIEESGCKLMVALFNGKPGDNLSAIRYSSLCKKVGAAKSFVTPERLPPTSSATKYHALRSYLQVMQWMGKDIDVTKWGWNFQANKLVPVMTDTAPAPEVLLRMISCKCSGGCSTFRCTCKKHGLNCTRACGPCQDGHCDNVCQDDVSDDEDESDT